MPAMFSWLNLIDSATLAAGDQSPALPVQNLKDRRVQNVWRSGSSISTYFTADFGSQSDIDVIGLFGATIGATDTVRIRLSNVSLGGNELFDQTVESNVQDGYDQFVYPLGETIAARYLRIDIDAESRAADGFFDIGRAWAGAGWQPKIGFSLGWTQEWNDLSTVTQSPRSGAVFVADAPSYRSMTVSFETLDDDDVAQARELDRIVGIRGQFLFLPDTVNGLPTMPILGRQVAGQSSGSGSAGSSGGSIVQQNETQPVTYSRTYKIQQDL